MYPSDGWELIRKDFGYGVNGSTVATRDAIYIVFYNKYRGILRVFSSLQNGSAYNGVTITLQFDDNTTTLSSNLDYASGLHALNDFPYNKTNQKPSISVPAQFLSSSWKWFFADFPIMYDPCTCSYASLLRITISPSTASTLNLSGDVSGDIKTSDATAKKDDTQYGIGEIGSSTFGKVVSAFNTTDVFKEKAESSASKVFVNGNNNILNGISSLTTDMKKPNFLKSGLSAIPYLDFAVNLFDAFIGGGKEAPGPQLVEIMPLAVSLKVNITGGINANYNFASPLFRAPGSDMTGADDYAYPLYNQPMGLISLLNKPKVISRDWYEGWDADPTPFNANEQYHRDILLKLNEPLQFVVNPASGLEVAEIRGAYIFRYPSDFTNFVDGEIGGLGLYVEHPTEGTFVTGTVDASTLTSVHPLNRYMYGNAIGVSDGPIKMRFTIRLHRKDATANTQDVLVTLTYPVDVDSGVLYSQDDVTNFWMSGYDSPYLITDNETIKSFCNNTGYKNNGKRGISAKVSYEEDLLKQIAAEKADLIKNSKAENKIESSLSISPNPLINGQGSVNYTLSQSGKVLLFVTSVTGVRVRTLLETEQEVGSFSFQLSLIDLPLGVYFITLETEGSREIKKIIVGK